MFIELLLFSSASPPVRLGEFSALGPASENGLRTMNIVMITEATIAAGKAAFHQYGAAQLCGTGTDEYAFGMDRETGARVVPGIILACIDAGFDGEIRIVHAAARISRCKRHTVQDVLDELEGTDPDAHLWTKGKDGRYRRLDRDSDRY